MKSEILLLFKSIYVNTSPKYEQNYKGTLVQIVLEFLQILTEEQRKELTVLFEVNYIYKRFLLYFRNNELEDYFN